MSHRIPYDLGLAVVPALAAVVTVVDGPVLVALIGFAIVIVQNAFAARSAQKHRQWDLEDRETERRRTLEATGAIRVTVEKAAVQAATRQAEIKEAIQENTELTAKVLEQK